MKHYFFFFCFVAQMAFGQVLFPYLQNPTPNSMIVNWKTASDNETTVIYGDSPTNLNVTVTGTTNIFSDTGYNNNYYYHTAKITNLQPNTKYYYKIKTGASESAVYNFRTLPLPGQPVTANGKIRFLIMGDNQIKAEPRYDSLTLNAFKKLKEKFGASSDPSDNIALTFMVGDQVDVGTLDHYENVHFKKNIKLSPYLPIQTTVGNHETYGTLGMNSYYAHFYIDEIKYKGIASGNENYYAQQAGNVLFISLSSEHTGSAQQTWLQQVLNEANNDSTVDWIISLSHRPYQAEQYVGDISTWVRNNAVPLLVTSSKYLMHVGAHHHLYHRGQLKNTPNYQIISGGTAWDQYWGMSNEQDFDDVQKTLTDWTYQIVEVDVPTGKVDIECYSIGGKYTTKHNELIDSFHRYKNQPKPAKPSVTNTFSGPVTLPLTLNGSAFSSSNGELLNTTQFLISKAADFSVIEKEFYRDFENWFGKDGNGNPDKTRNLNEGVDITKATLAANSIPNGTYYVKTRYRDRNLEWSDWSEVKQFEVTGSVVSNPTFTLDKTEYTQNEPIVATFTGGPGNQQDWVGIYKKGQTPGGGATAQTYVYTNGQTAGTATFNNGLPNKGQYFAGFFANNGYTDIASRKSFYVGPKVQLQTTADTYPVGGTVTINFTNAPSLQKDWIGIYKMGQTPGTTASIKWSYVTTASGTLNFTGLPKGYYYAQYLLEDGYNGIGEKVFFKVGDIVTELWTNKPVYSLGENITASWTDSPGIIKDWLGIYPQNVQTPDDNFVSYTYFDGVTQGTKTITGNVNGVPTTPGNYYMVMFTNDSYTEVSNRVQFQVSSGSLGLEEAKSTEKNVILYPNPTKPGEPTFIKSDYPIEKIELVSAAGELLYESKNIHNQRFSLVNENLPKGVYFVKVHARKLFTLKLIIQ
ncbi:fibronectin type III domain-containing protein [Chryseobacterium arthrosphaerae]|uniref:fibronectin type III domain-containing protein n=1 Tax=Chryseobacterium arthrosphaerae TaxID=651561 RepID=UPI001E30DA5B|nr:fibronectin type III domain-containing protein [Chryseobacterium arthrosphaerae]UEQ76609.1 fibronectin type III domain-containing protein [Chryseobacterium arthrosphaerae]